MRKYTTNEIEKMYDEVESIPIAQLRDLWIVKYGNAWVDVSDLDVDLFYTAVCRRLMYAGFMEKHHIPTKMESVFRIKEEQCQTHLN